MEASTGERTFLGLAPRQERTKMEGVERENKTTQGRYLERKLDGLEDGQGSRPGPVTDKTNIGKLRACCASE